MKALAQVSTGTATMTKMSTNSIPSKSESPRMFDRISGRYDLLNHLLSFGQDLFWRKKVASLVAMHRHDVVLDLACGTCDLLLSAFDRCDNIKLGVGVDMAGRMLGIGKRKIEKRSIESKISLAVGDGMHLPLFDQSVDFSMISFGIRNMPDPAIALRELHRVTRVGGKLAVLEFSIPKTQPFASVYMLYFRHILPVIGGILSGDCGAYSYLNKTVETFHYGEAFIRMIEVAGFERVIELQLTMGVASIYLGTRS
jgi:demethylmenaquinone methyltransferase/2-methoxy-6-polyprenyl-1,4-benzoquinol methylase